MVVPGQKLRRRPHENRRLQLLCRTSAAKRLTKQPLSNRPERRVNLTQAIFACRHTIRFESCSGAQPQVANAGLRSTERAGGITLGLDLAERRIESVIHQEMSRQTLAESEQLLQHLGRLQ